MVVAVSCLPIVIELWRARKEHGADDPVTDAIISSVVEDD